ncbi:unnamed protein product [Owenia fusiformis]|uniref:MADF domain-containing protein n=1 Tax=Owenia fusiformis TaxID=6347 RepID=A0A8S4N2G5_OWEFU|nr:unnamed protein product [Owenia fusiformis]
MNKVKRKNTKRQDHKIEMKKDPKIEKELVEFYKMNPSLWDIRLEDHHNRDNKKKLLEDISKSTGVSVENIVGWWKGIRDTYTRLSLKKSGSERDDLPYKQKWVLQNLSFLSNRPVHRRTPIKSLAEDSPAVDLNAAEREAVRQGKDDDLKRKSKGKKHSEDEDKEITMLQNTAKESISVLESLKESVNKVAVKREEPFDVATLYGRYLTQEMRQMSKRRFKLFRREVEASLAKYNSSTDSEDDAIKPLAKKTSSSTSSTVTPSSSGPTNSFYASGMHQSHGGGWQPPPSRWIPNPPQTASPWHSQDDRYMQQYFQQQRKQLTPQMHPTLQSPNRRSLINVSYGQSSQGHDDLSRGSLRPPQAIPIASPLTQALLSSGMDILLQEKPTQEHVNIPAMPSNLPVLGEEGLSMDVSLVGSTRPTSAPVLPSASDAFSTSAPRSQSSA